MLGMLNVHTDVDAPDCTHTGAVKTPLVRESALQVKILNFYTGQSNPRLCIAPDLSVRRSVKRTVPP